MVSLTVDPFTNRISTPGFSYDAAGNLIQWPGGTVTVLASYDADGRIMGIGYTWGAWEPYYYDARNRRVKTGYTRFQFYGLGGELLGEYERVEGRWAPRMVRERVYFAGLWVGTVEGDGSWSMPNTDRLGSLKYGLRRYPFGDGNESYAYDEYATYRKDHASAHYYAWHRYYSATWDRFSSPDPYVMSGGLTNPQGWNRYSYVANDPVNFHDPAGLFRRVPTGSPITYLPLFPLGPSSSGVPIDSGPGFGSGDFWGMETVESELEGGNAPPPPPCDVVVPDDPDFTAAVGVVLGENSYIYIGSRSYSPGDTFGNPTGPVITRELVQIESQIMVSVLLNRTGRACFGGSTIAAVAAAPEQFVGYKPASELLKQLPTAPQNSLLCDRVRLAVENVQLVLSNPEAFSYNYYYWKATVDKNNQVRVRYSGELWVARTAFHN